MMSHLNDLNGLYAEMHMRELRAAAQEARRARQTYQPRRLRRRIGRTLIAAGESLIS
jgi:hypothetical protein